MIEGKLPRFRRPPTAQEAVLAELRRYINTGGLRPGTQIVQDVLAEELGVSRVPLREALKTLEAEGHVDYIAHRGYFVAELSLADLLEVNRLRQLLEAEAIRVAGPQLTSEAVERMVDLERDLEIAGEQADIATMQRVNQQFHFVLFEAARMPRLERLLRVLWDATEVYRAVYLQSPTQRARVLDDHQMIIDSAVSGDPEEVIRILDRHRDNAATAIRGMLERREA
jgi:DNA-binding GntR family transcriptional regulator